MRIFLDDLRATPEGWVRCFWPQEVIALLVEHRGQVEALSLDHDLGDDLRGTGYDVLSWLEEAVALDDYPAPASITVHSDNAPGIARMRAAVAAIRRFEARR